VHGIKFPVIYADLGDDQGEMQYEPEPGGQIRIRIHQRFSGTDYAWLVLFHEMCHAALAVSGATAHFGGKTEEAVVLATEAVWQALVAVASERVASRGNKGRATKSRSSTRSARRPSR
jgi:vacuolar-type H+-ATPase catalytic subunit A/Vma1